MPELWHWHVPGSRYGVTDLVAYDVDTGMALAAGTVDKGKEEIAQRIFERGPKVSHGMPTPEIRREEGDPTVLVRYRSKEISTLPPEAAANKITFYDLKEQDDMEIPEKKLEALRELGFDMDELEAKLGAGRERAESEERESKEAETKAEETEAVAETEQAQPDAAPESAPEQEPLTAEAVAAAFTSAIAPITERLDALEGQIKELSEPTETKEEEPDKTPQASLASLMKSAVIGKEATRVDGRTTRHDAPAETVATKEEKGALNTGKLLPDTIINDIVSGRLHRELREKFGAQEQ